MDYDIVAGLEIHVQLSTNTKLFCRCDNDSFNVSPNTNVCPVCMGFPGQLPVLNEGALDKALRASLALNCEIQTFSKFDRKSYFYPDSPKGFQISQYDEPIAENGSLEVTLPSGEKKKIGITRVHMEDDAGKLVHTDGGTLCDFNRSGTPLIEIVSEPDMTCMEDASQYARSVQQIVRYVGSSTCDMEKGMMRFDINISLKPKGQKEFGTKVEIKNVNSFRSLERAFLYEVERQKALLDKGEKIVQETRGWDDNRGTTITQRLKEEADDYRYFPEPDLPPLEFKIEDIEELKKSLPEMPAQKTARFISDYSLNEDDARILVSSLDLAGFYEEVAAFSNDPKKAVSFVNTVLMAKLNEDLLDITECKVTAQNLGDLIKMVNSGEVSVSQARNEIFAEMYSTGQSPKEIVDRLGIKQVSDEGELKSVCEKVVAANPEPVADFKAGKEKAFAFLMGQIMKETKGQANPALVNKILKDLLG